MELLYYANLSAGFGAAIAAFFAAKSNFNAMTLHQASLKAQRDMKRQEIFFQIANTWNGETLLQTRLSVDGWLERMPPDEDPRAWLAAQQSAPDWTRFAMIAHFLRHVQSLIKDEILVEAHVSKHLGAAGWWARELMCIYNVWSKQEHLMVEALADLALIYDIGPGSRKGTFPYPEYYLNKIAKLKPRPLEFDSSSWAPRSTGQL